MVQYRAIFTMADQQRVA